MCRYAAQGAARSVRLDIASDTTTDAGGMVRAEELRASLQAAAAWLERHREAVDALNVFPVPDGDTGLNMSLTLRAAADEAAAVDGSLGEVAAAMARGALMGARGNSGVILAQLLRGIARELEGQQAVDSHVLAKALSAGADAAYGAVAHPVEGTILTVARRAAEAARQTAAGSGTLTDTVERAHEAARIAVAETPDLLPILKQAGVVDSGGEGLRIMLEGILLYLKGEPVGSGSIPIEMRVDFSSLHSDFDDASGYCTEVLFRGKELNVDAIRDRLGGLGTCVLAVGDSELMKIHVHTPRPGAVLDVATELGEIMRVKVDNMEIQRRDFAAAVGRQRPEASSEIRAAGTSVVAVALGGGFQKIFESYGATVVRVDRTMNPSVEQILDAINRTNRSDVVILPNDRNVLLATQEAAKQLTDRTVEIVSTLSMPCGIAAMLAVNPEASASENTGPMLADMSNCRCIELTRAVRTARLGDLDLQEGSLFATLDGTPVAAGDSYPQLLDEVLSQLVEGRFEIATVYFGSQGSRADAARLADTIGSRLGIAVEIANSGQPHYDYIISVE
jgi:uncharacterized protein